jgi:GNAT superfamily N-acetyltransferase
MRLAESTLRVEPLADRHDRVSFRCGSEELERYLQKQAGQDLRKRVSAVFILTEDSRRIAGYYTLSAHQFRIDDLPEDIAKRLPRYGVMPATLLGRFAIATEFQRQGLGEALLMDCLERSLRNAIQVASWAVIVDAKGTEAANFYTKYDFIAFPNNPKRLFLPMKRIEGLFDDK